MRLRLDVFFNLISGDRKRSVNLFSPRRRRRCCRISIRAAKKQGILLLAKFLHRDDGGGWMGCWWNERNGALSVRKASFSRALRCCVMMLMFSSKHQSPPPGDANKLRKKLPAEFGLRSVMLFSSFAVARLDE
jgi:hypothetical protein